MRHLEEKIKRVKGMHQAVRYIKSINTELRSGGSASISVHAASLRVTENDWPELADLIGQKVQEMTEKLERESAALNAFEAILKLESDSKEADK